MAVWHNILLPETLALEGSKKMFAYCGSCRSRKEQLAFDFMDCVIWRKNIFFCPQTFALAGKKRSHSIIFFISDGHSKKRCLSKFWLNTWYSNHSQFSFSAGPREEDVFLHRDLLSPLWSLCCCQLDFLPRQSWGDVSWDNYKIFSIAS